ncbi:hypothetical protein DPMN_127918, partial [Dreissena polymorpha]
MGYAIEVPTSFQSSATEQKSAAVNDKTLAALQHWCALRVRKVRVAQAIALGRPSVCMRCIFAFYGRSVMGYAIEVPTSFQSSATEQKSAAVNDKTLAALQHWCALRVRKVRVAQAIALGRPSVCMRCIFAFYGRSVMGYAIEVPTSFQSSATEQKSAAVNDKTLAALQHWCALRVRKVRVAQAIALGRP